MRFQLENVYDVFVFISFKGKLFALAVMYGKMRMGEVLADGREWAALNWAIEEEKLTRK